MGLKNLLQSFLTPTLTRTVFGVKWMASVVEIFLGRSRAHSLGGSKIVIR